MKRLERRQEKKKKNCECFQTDGGSVFLYLSLHLHLHPFSTLCPRLLIPCLFCAPSLSLFSPRVPGCLSPSQEKRPHHYQPGQATPGDMASNERKIHPAFSSAPLPLSASIYLSSLAALLHPLTPHTPPPFLIRQIPRELEAISAAGTGVTCVCVCLCDLGACV